MTDVDEKPEFTSGGTDNMTDVDEKPEFSSGGRQHD